MADYDLSRDSSLLTLKIPLFWDGIFSADQKLCVPERRLELPQSHALLEPESSASTDSATRAPVYYDVVFLRWKVFFKENKTLIDFSSRLWLNISLDKFQ